MMRITKRPEARMILAGASGSQRETRAEILRTSARVLLALAVVLSALLPAFAPVPALAATQRPTPAQQTDTPTGVDAGALDLPGLRIGAEGDGLRIVYEPPPAASINERLALAGERVRYQGYDLPLQVIPVRAATPAVAQSLQVLQVASEELPAGLLTPGPAIEPVVVEGLAAQHFAEPPAPQLPHAPLFVLDAMEMDGAWIVVLAVTPVYAEAGSVRFANRVEAWLPQAQRVAELSKQPTAAEAAAVMGEEAATMGASAAACAAYTLPLVNTGELILRVHTPGLQRIARAELDAFKESNASQISLSLHGKPVPVQIAGGYLYFYAEAVGDRWNLSDAYVLRNASARYPALPIATAAVGAGTAGAPSVVTERGVWRNNKVYSSLYAGLDGDHWMAGDLWVNPDARSADLTAVLNNSALLTPRNALPAAAGDMTLTYNVTPYQGQAGVAFNYTLVGRTPSGVVRETQIGPISAQAVEWPASLSASATFPNAPSVTLALKQSAHAHGLLVDSIAYSRPVSLGLHGASAVFEGAAGATTFRWTGAGAAPMLFDVTDPDAIVQLTGANENGFTETGAGGRTGARRYLVAPVNALQTPTREAVVVQNYASLSGVQAIYIAPNAEFADALKPLTDLRCASYKVAVVDVRAIYNRYSHGQISQEAIRDFLRDAWFAGGANGGPAFDHFTWSPISVVLAGDADYDPWEYTLEEGQSRKSSNLIPAYMHPDVDPYMGETSCDNCYGQLDGDDPHRGDSSAQGNLRRFVMEISVGRLPANDVAELAGVVEKIVRYETTGSNSAPWRSNMLLLADNYWKPQVGGGYSADLAGDFATTSEDLRALYPVAAPAVDAYISRVYFDPAPHLNQPSAAGQPWRVTDDAQLSARVVSALNDKPALVVYNGHANLWYMGDTDRETDKKHLLGLNDVWLLNNLNEPFFMLSMTCLTSAFATPAAGGNTIDESFLLHPSAGAVATWGSSGQSAVAGHEILQRGFFKQLYKTPQPQTLRQLMRAGYEEVMLYGVHAEDVMRTFTLLGDPLTKFRFNFAQDASFLPTVQHRK